MMGVKRLWNVKRQNRIKKTNTSRPSKYHYHIDNINIKDNTMGVAGWLFSENRKTKCIKLTVKRGNREKFYSMNDRMGRPDAIRRPDVYAVYQNANAIRSGFDFNIMFRQYGKYKIYIQGNFLNGKKIRIYIKDINIIDKYKYLNLFLPKRTLRRKVIDLGIKFMQKILGNCKKRFARERTRSNVARGIKKVANVKTLMDKVDQLHATKKIIEVIQ